jgi:hypothetical protein
MEKSSTRLKEIGEINYTTDPDNFKKLVVINDIIHLLNQQKPLNELLVQICNIIPVAYNMPDLINVKIIIDGKQYTSDIFNETPWLERHKFDFPDNKEGIIEIYYLKQYIQKVNNETLIRDEKFLNNIAYLINGAVSKNRLITLLYENTERLKELKGINRTAEILRKGFSLDESLQTICSFLPEAWQYPQFTVARIRFEDKVFISSNEFTETAWGMGHNFVTPDNKKGSIDVFYLKEFPESDIGPFLKEEQHLIDNLASLISGTVSKNALQELLLSNTERLKELKEINLTTAILNDTEDFNQSLQAICANLADAWQYPEYTVARITYDKQVYVSNNFKETPWTQKQSFKAPGKKNGLIEIFYLKEFPFAFEGPFLKEERDLLTNLASLIEGSATKNIFNKLLAENKERLKELRAINQTSAIIAEGLSIEQTLQDICNILPRSWQYPKYTTARISFEEIICESPDFSETEWAQKETFVTIDNKKGTIEIFYLKEFPEIYEGPFLKEERHLLINVGKLITGFLNSYKGRDIYTKSFKKEQHEHKPDEYRKSLIENKEPLQLFFNKQALDKYIYLDMMKYKVKEILFVATLYDAFILENEDSFFEQFMGVIYQYSLFSLPRITGVTSSEQALGVINTTQFDIVILMAGIDSEAPVELSKKIREKRPDLPIYLLLNQKGNVKLFEELIPKTNSIDKLFVWNGHSQIFFAIVKSIEDNANAENDTKIGLVRVILLIEDSSLYYSKFLQTLYSIVFGQVQQLLPEFEKNELDKICKMRSRPKILHARNYEEAVYIFNKYKDFMLCVISDVEFEKNGLLDNKAGIKFIKYARSNIKNLPIILHSADVTNKITADKNSVFFIDKNSENLSNELKNFLTNYLYFGDFIFKDKDGNHIAIAKSLRDFETLLQQIPDESFIAHANENQFSLWLMSRGEIQLARSLNPIKISDFESNEKARQFFVDTFRRYKEEKKKGKILSYDETSVLDEKNIVSFASGSLGGKGRGLAFINALIYNLDFSFLSKEINIRTPITAIIGTDEFECFLEDNGLYRKIYNTKLTYEEIQRLFVTAQLSHALMRKLEFFLDQIKRPIAVRSSSLSEDSLTQPFAGVFDTYIITNNDADRYTTLLQLAKAIKLVYASIYSDNSRMYFQAINHRVEDERMAVVLQELVGNRFDRYYYPHISGTAQSYNYYPIANMKPEEGYAIAAVGLGYYVVGGRKSFRFSPKYPKIQPYSTKDLLNSTQVNFMAVDLDRNEIDYIKEGEMASVALLDISVAESHGTLVHCASTYNADNDNIAAGLDKSGPRIIDFGDIFKFNYIPLAETIDTMLNTIGEALGSPVEIEYAVDLNRTTNNLPSFYLLQIKPLISQQLSNDFELDESDPTDKVLLTHASLGNGIIENISDVIFVDNDKFDKLRTMEMVKEIEQLNNLMVKQNRKYVLIGPGRWGTRDQFLGIPVAWSQISNAKVIVEISLANFPLDSSLGSHFFHNITSMNIGYFAILDSSPNDYVRWDILNQQQLINTTNFFRHIRFENPLKILMNGKQKTSVILNTE